MVLTNLPSFGLLVVVRTVTALFVIDLLLSIHPFARSTLSVECLKGRSASHSGYNAERCNQPLTSFLARAALAE